MEILVKPSDFFNHGPFMVKVTYNETIENLINVISLTIMNIPITKMSLRYNNKAIKKNMRLDQIGIRDQDSIDLVESKSNCCVLL